MKRDSVFLSYDRSNEFDVRCRDELVSHLEVILGPGVRIFADRDIGTREKREHRIREELDRARVMVMLVSPDFLSSRFFHKVELPYAARMARRGELTIACLYLSPSTVVFTWLRVADPEGDYFEVCLMDYQDLNDPRATLMSLERERQHEALVAAAETVERLMRGDEARELSGLPAESARVEPSLGVPVPIVPAIAAPADWSVLDPTLVDGCARRIEDPKTGVIFVRIPSGEFEMGPPDSGGPRVGYYGPQYKVRIAKAFYLAETVITREQWARGQGEPRPPSSERRLPKLEVSWHEALHYCEAAGYRLPSEAEWEYACREGGPTNDLFGDYWYFLGEYPNVALNGGDELRAVPREEANTFGLFDMHGIPWEWCQDRWHDSYEGAPEDGSAWEEGGSECRVFRGGGHVTTGYGYSFEVRHGASPGSRHLARGFRPAVDFV